MPRIEFAQKRDPNVCVAIGNPEEFAISHLCPNLYSLLNHILLYGITIQKSHGQRVLAPKQTRITVGLGSDSSSQTRNIKSLSCALEGCSSWSSGAGMKRHLSLWEWKEPWLLSRRC